MNLIGTWALHFQPSIKESPESEKGCNRHTTQQRDFACIWLDLALFVKHSVFGYICQCSVARDRFTKIKSPLFNYIGNVLQNQKEPFEFPMHLSWSKELFIVVKQAPGPTVANFFKSGHWILEERLHVYCLALFLSQQIDQRQKYKVALEQSGTSVLSTDPGELFKLSESIPLELLIQYSAMLLNPSPWCLSIQVLFCTPKKFKIHWK